MLPQFPHCQESSSGGRRGSVLSSPMSPQPPKPLCCPTGMGAQPGAEEVSPPPPPPPGLPQDTPRQRLRAANSPPMTDLLLSCTTCENACTPAGVYACVCACLCMGVSARARVCTCVCTRMGVCGCARMCACRCRWVCMRVFVQEASRRGWRMVVPWLRVHRAQGATECLIHAAGQRWLQQKRCWMHQKQHWVQQGWQ